MPDFPIVDCHVHLYDPSRIAYPWLRTVPAIDRAHLPADFDAACGTLQVERMVFVEVDAAEAQALDEAVFVAGLARAEPRIAGIVAAAPLERGAAAAADLDRLMAVPGLRGVRRLIQNHPQPDWCLQPGFVAGVGLLAKYGLSFDVCIRHHQLASATELVRRCPDVQFVLDHIAKPPIAAGLREPWATQLQAMAALPNVVCKLSGVATEADHATWTPGQLRPYIDHAVACFGWDRLLFASDWPVMTLATRYRDWVALLDDVLADAGEADRRAFYRDNAMRVYRLGR